MKEGRRILRTERYFGQVSRSFQLGARTWTKAARPPVQRRVLELTLPKKVAPAGQAPGHQINKPPVARRWPGAGGAARRPFYRPVSRGAPSPAAGITIAATPNPPAPHGTMTEASTPPTCPRPESPRSSPGPCPTSSRFQDKTLVIRSTAATR